MALIYSRFLNLYQRRNLSVSVQRKRLQIRQAAKKTYSGVQFEYNRNTAWSALACIGAFYQSAKKMA